MLSGSSTSPSLSASLDAALAELDELRHQGASVDHIETTLGWWDGQPVVHRRGRGAARRHLTCEALILEAVRHPALVPLLRVRCRADAIELTTRFCGNQRFDVVAPGDPAAVLESLASLAEVVGELHALGVSTGGIEGSWVRLGPHGPVLVDLGRPAPLDDRRRYDDLVALHALATRQLEMATEVSSLNRDLGDRLAQRLGPVPTDAHGFAIRLRERRDTCTGRSVDDEALTQQTEPASEVDQPVERALGLSRTLLEPPSTVLATAAAVGVVLLVGGVSIVTGHTSDPPATNPASDVGSSSQLPEQISSPDGLGGSDPAAIADPHESLVGLDIDEAEVYADSMRVHPDQPGTTSPAREQSGDELAGDRRSCTEVLRGPAPPGCVVVTNDAPLHWEGVDYLVEPRGAAAMSGDWSCDGTATLMVVTDHDVAVYPSWPTPEAVVAPTLHPRQPHETIHVPLDRCGPATIGDHGRRQLAP